MITLELTGQQLDELYDGLSSNGNPSARKKCLAVYLRAKGYPREAIADITRGDPDNRDKPCHLLRPSTKLEYHYPFKWDSGKSALSACAPMGFCLKCG